ncbi:MAG TPA: hypothetical protein VFD82_15610 [Planctomycetota bacterium]|nr:hypothetical protein [Planctomycetota bacterium]
MQLAVYAHPFDLQALAAHGGLPRLRDLGIGEVALATSYHDGRWLMPWQDEGRVRFLEDGTVHFRPGSDYGELRPQTSRAVPAKGPSPLELLCEQAPAAGMRVRAWNVFTHNSRLGAKHPELCVHNAFGDVYTYALCPAQPKVQQYIAAMVRDLGWHKGLHTIEFEALGQMGHKHSSHHDKASFTATGLLDAALSACFCSACEKILTKGGTDPEELRRSVQSCVDTHVSSADAMTPGTVPAGPKDLAAGDARWLDAVLDARARTVQQLARIALNAPQQRAVQVHPHPWFTGSQLAAASAASFPATDERVVTCYGEGPGQIGRLLGGDDAVRLRASPRRLCIWPKAPEFMNDRDLEQVRDLCRQHGIASIAIYHLGLLPWRTIERVAKKLAA